MPTLNLGRVRFNLRGPYDPDTDYLKHDVVTDDGQSYACIADVTGTGPNDAGGATYWEGMLLRGADYNVARDQAVQAASNAGNSATAASQSANAAASDRDDAQSARDKSQAWAESDTAPEPGSKSAKTWAAEAASYGDPNQHNVTANGTADTRSAAEWAGQTLSNQQAINGLGTAATARAEHLASSPYCTDIGTANAYALSVNYTKAAPTSYSDGDQYRFRAAASNTGTSTVNINDLDAKTLVTVTGVALPAGYIRTDVDTTITYDETNDRFVADREMERGSNANGEYTRWADGSQSAVVKDAVLTYASEYVVIFVWTFPAAFNNEPDFVDWSGRDDSAVGFPDDIRAKGAVVCDGATSTSVKLIFLGAQNSFSPGDQISAKAFASGPWY
ncbi:hypothetical protein KUV74_01530 [Halomonas sp. DP1Y21-3]|uniref:hypothetical protein n=1 Tax=Halomonas sp. DP1Y21-3 TaxID=2859080 RepID=UPI001C94CC43|nr:hypothetical protein [Halomonas sp. DP1Y21-3]MBY6109072.1 hypothetical protein [Halomonas sp. DP1Y21-3]